jgi:integrating conjugative element protein (TIGR03765 family)
MPCKPIEFGCRLGAITALSLMFTGFEVLAQPVVIFDQGPTRPVADYLEPLPVLAMPAPKAPAKLAVPAHAYPLRTLGLSPGAVESRTVRLPQLAAAPFFLVGSDAFSRQWLASQAGRLAAMGAVGFLVEASSEADWQAARQLAPGVPITVLDAAELAKSLGLSHYPVLVSSGQVAQ